MSEISDITEDALLGGRIKVRQPKRGYRVNVDTLLLAAAVEAMDGARLMEAGCGVGAASLAVAARAHVSIVAVERDAAMADLARANVADNAMDNRIEIVTADALDREAEWGVFDGVFFNPPYDSEREGRAPAEARRAAYIAGEPLERWVAILADRLSGGAALTLIQRAHKLGDILGALEGRLGGAEVVPIRPWPEAPAKRVIVRARKGSRAPLKLHPGLDLHPAGASQDKYLPAAEAILRDGAPIRFG